MELTLSRLSDFSETQIDFSKFKNGNFYKQLLKETPMAIQDYFAIRDKNNKIVLIYQVQRDTLKSILSIPNLTICEDAPKYIIMKELFDTLSILYPSFSIDISCKDYELIDIYKKIGFRTTNSGHIVAKIIYSIKI